jgi:hypothetical protein
MKNVDFINIDESGAVEVMPNGFISITANLTRTGIFTYRHVRPDGSIQLLKQLRVEEEVFSEEAMSSLSGLPITNNHPSELVSPENASDFIVGMASDNPKRIHAPVQGDSEDYIQQKLTIFDDVVIDLIQGKEKGEMSLGYQCELDFTEGDYKGEHYDCTQRNIRYNHGSIVDQARGGPNCKILLDDTEVILDGLSVDEANINNGEEPNVKKFTFDGTDYQVEDNVHGLLTSLVTKLDSTDDLVKSGRSELDKKTAVCDDLTSQVKVLKDSADDVEKFNGAVKARVELESAGRKVLGEEIVLDGLTDREIKEKVIAKARPECVLDGKSEDYVTARYEIALEDSSDEVIVKNGEEGLGENINNQDASDGKPNAEKARQAAWDHDANLWKGE